VWYGRAGLLALHARLVAEVTDVNGRPLGTMVFEQHQRLADLDLVRSNARF